MNKTKRLNCNWDMIKKFLVLFIINALFFKGFFIAFLQESTIPSWYLQYSILGVIFFFVYLIYIPFYGFCSVWYSKQLFMPHCQLFCFTTAFFCVGSKVPFHLFPNHDSVYDRLIGNAIMVVVSVGISLAFGLLAKRILKMQEKKVAND